MNIFTRMRCKIADYRRARAYWRLYEAAERQSTKRGYLPFPEPQDARLDIGEMDRTEMVRKSRGFYANDAIADRLCDIFEQFTVGPNGLQIFPDSTEDEWNDAMLVCLDGWYRFPDLTSRLPWSVLQALCACLWFVDGECFILKTYGEETTRRSDGTTATIRRPRVQLIESHRVGNPSNPPNGAVIYDGVQVDKRGRPTHYWVLVTDNVTNESKHVPIEADKIIHIFEPHRPNQYRGIPFLAPVMNDLQDLNELQAFAKHKAKENSSITRVLETPGGEFATASAIREKVLGRNQSTTGADITEERTKWMQRLFGPRSLAIKTGDKLTEFLNNTPSVADQALWSHLTSRVCIGTGIPKILVFPESIQGTVARGDLDVANAFFRARSEVLAGAFKEVHFFVMEWEVQNTIEVSDPPSDWRKVFVCPPRAVNVDVGYNAAAVIADLEAGNTTYRDTYGMRGKFWKTEIRQRAREEAYIDRVCKEFKTTPDRVRRAISESLKLEMEKKTAAQDKEDNAITV